MFSQWRHYRRPGSKRTTRTTLRTLPLITGYATVSAVFDTDNDSRLSGSSRGSP